MPEPLTVVGYVLSSFLFLLVVIQVSGLYDIVKGLRQTFQRDKDVYDEGKKAYDAAIAAKLTTGEAAANQRAAMLAAYLKKYPESTPEQVDKAVKDILALNMSTEDLIEFIRVETEYHQAKGNDEEVEKLKKEKQDLLDRVPGGDESGGNNNSNVGNDGDEDTPQGIPLPLPPSPPQVYPNPAPLPLGDGTFGAKCGGDNKPCDDTKGLICDTLTKQCSRVQNVVLNGACSVNTQCALSNGRPVECKENRCKLIPGTGIEGSFCGEVGDTTCLASSFLECNSTTKKCQKISPVPAGAPCDFLSVCVANLSCVNGKCGAPQSQQTPPPPTIQLDETCPSTNQSGVERVRVTYKTSGSIYGGDCGVYTGDSDINRAATHQGLVTASNPARCISKRNLPGRTFYPSIILNGITSSSWGGFSSSYKIWDGSEPSCSTTYTPPVTAGNGQKCGAESVGGNVKCDQGLCCSVGSWCGKTKDHCCQGNQSDFNGGLAPSCNTATQNDTTGASTTGVLTPAPSIDEVIAAVGENVNATVQNMVANFTLGNGAVCTDNDNCTSKNCFGARQAGPNDVKGISIKGKCRPKGYVETCPGHKCSAQQLADGAICNQGVNGIYKCKKEDIPGLCISTDSGITQASNNLVTQFGLISPNNGGCWIRGTYQGEYYAPPPNIKSRYKRL